MSHIFKDLETMVEARATETEKPKFKIKRKDKI